jgi:hypothetical protein
VTPHNSNAIAFSLNYTPAHSNGNYHNRVVTPDNTNAIAFSLDYMPAHSNGNYRKAVVSRHNSKYTRAHHGVTAHNSLAMPA